MSLLVRTRSDGRKAPGYLVYLIAGLAGVAVVWGFHRPPAARPRAKGRDRGGKASVGAITEPAAMMSPVAVRGKAPAGAARSFRLASPVRRPGRKKKGEGSADAGFDPIEAALSESPPPAPPSAADTGFASLPPAFAPEAGVGGKGSKSPGPLLLGYRDRTADPLPADAPPADNGRPKEGPSTEVLPRATLLPAILLTTVDTSNPSAVLQFGVARDVLFRRQCLIPFGTRLLGRLAGHAFRDRLNLSVDTLLFPDGREVPISATAVEADENGADIRPGVAAYYFPPPGWVQIEPYVSDAFSGLMGLLQSRAESQLALGVGGLTLQSSNPASARAPFYQASAQAVEDFTAARLKEVEERYASYHLIPAGSQFWLQVENDVDLGKGPGAR